MRRGEWAGALRLNARSIVAVFLACAPSLLAAAAQAQAIKFRDRTFEIETRIVYSSRDALENTSFQGQPTESVLSIEAVAGRLVWIGNVSACVASLVYVPGRANSGRIDCPPERVGTASDWNERSGTATFQTSATIEGDVLTLRGEMIGVTHYQDNLCGRSSASVLQYRILQTLKMRVAGESCEVLELSVQESEEETSDDPRRHEIVRIVTSAKPSLTCRISRRSDHAAPTSALRDPSFHC